MSDDIRVGQPINEVVGLKGDYVGNGNSLQAQAVLATLGKGFQSDIQPSLSGQFNGGALGVNSALKIESPKPSFAPVPTMQVP